MAAGAGNNVCGVGVAYGAKIGGIVNRMTTLRTVILKFKINFVLTHICESL